MAKVNNVQLAAKEAGGIVTFHNFSSLCTRNGCGSPIRVIGTNAGYTQCGSNLKLLSGKTIVALCDNC